MANIITQAYNSVLSYLGPQRAANEAGQNTRLTLYDIKRDPARVMIQIIRQQRSLYKKEIDHWISARQYAQDVFFPNRQLLYALYDDIILDGFIHGQVYNHRILRISNKKFKIVNAKTKETDEVKTELLEREWFNELVKYAMESRFYGHSLIYIKELDKEIRGVDLVYREHVRPEHSLILKNPFDTTGVDFSKPPFSNYVLGAGNVKDLGLLNKAAPYYILKKHSWANWDQFEEIFGIPIRIAKTASQDKKVQAEIEAWLKEMGSAAYGMFPADTEIEVKESARSDAFEVFDKKRIACNEELAILINGNTMTSMDGSSRSQAEVHERSQEEITKDDATFIKYLVNSKLLPLLIKNGYPFAEQDQFDWDESVELTTTGKVNVYKNVSDMGFELDQQDVENTFGVKIVGKKAVAPPAAPPPGTSEEEPKSKEDPGKK